MFSIVYVDSGVGARVEGYQTDKIDSQFEMALAEDPCALQTSMFTSCFTSLRYVVANNDRTVHPDLQRFLAKRMGATTRAVDSSHVAMLLQPGVVVDVIRAAVSAVRGERLDIGNSRLNDR